eukprot:EG_transcript_5444
MRPALRCALSGPACRIFRGSGCWMQRGLRWHSAPAESLAQPVNAAQPSPAPPLPAQSGDLAAPADVLAVCRDLKAVVAREGDAAVPALVRHLLAAGRDTPSVMRNVMTALCNTAQLWDLVRQCLPELVLAQHSKPGAAETELFNIWLQCCGTAKRYTMMREVEQLMEDLQVPLDDETFVCLLSHGPKSLPEVKRVLGMLQEYAQAMAETADPGAQRGVARAFCALMAAFAHLKEWRAVEGVVEALPHSADVYVTAVRLFGSVARDLPKMEEMIGRMKMAGFRPSDAVLCSAIDAYSRAHNFAKVMHLLRDLTADGRPLSDELCGAVAVALVRMRRVGEAEVFLGDLDKRGAVLGDQVFQEICLHLITHYGACRDFTTLHSTLAQLKNRKIDLSPRLRRRLLRIYADSLHLGHLRTFLEGAWPLTEGERPLVAKAYRESGFPLQAEQVLQGRFPDPPTDPRPGLTPARQRWLAWRLIDGRFAAWCRTAVGQPVADGGPPTLDGMTLGQEEFDYAATHFVAREAVEDVQAVLMAARRFGVPLSDDVVAKATACTAGSPEPPPEGSTAVAAAPAAPSAAPLAPDTRRSLPRLTHAGEVALMPTGAAPPLSG